MHAVRVCVVTGRGLQRRHSLWHGSESKRSGWLRALRPAETLQSFASNERSGSKGTIVKSFAAILASTCITLASCTGPMALQQERVAVADLIDAAGARTGSVALASSGGRLTLTVEVAGLAPGEHGMHLHAVGRCERQGFSSAGPHLNPNGRQHGAANPQGKHLGDLPNLTVGSRGRGRAVVPLDGSWSEYAAALLDSDGTALVVHAGADDYKTNPSGNSGDRIACGVLRPLA